MSTLLILFFMLMFVSMMWAMLDDGVGLVIMALWMLVGALLGFFLLIGFLLNGDIEALTALCRYAAIGSVVLLVQNLLLGIVIRFGDPVWVDE